MMLVGTSSSLFMMPVFWLVVGVLFLGLELVNRRMVYFLPGCVAAVAVALLMILHPMLPTFLPQLPSSPGAALLIWTVLSCGGSAVFAMLRPRIRRRNRRRNRRQLFTS
ncbi:MAG: hypothetical protein VW830_07570 [Rhodobiaceae bacterium]